MSRSKRLQLLELTSNTRIFLTRIGETILKSLCAFALDLRIHTQAYKTTHRIPCIGTIKPLLLTSLLLLTYTSAFATDRYQFKMLFTPNETLLMSEAKGRITIYDGLDINTVDRAMDEQFDRIDNMMFVRVQHPQDNGEDIVEDDDCD